ncbi:MAG: diguanylate cyclase, partial [Eubacterium sp.]
MIDWKGRPARMEIAMDITEQNDLNKLVTYRLEIEDTLVNCIKKLVSAKDINEAINTVLEAVASFYKAERAYICEMNETEEQLRIDYEWMKETEAFMNTKKEEPKRLALAMSLNQREEYPDVICPDIAVFKETMPDVYTGLKKLKIKNFMSVHFSMEKDKQNHIVIENYERPEACSELLKSITYFIITEYTKRSTQDKMQEMLYHDPMTGLFNRYGYLKDIVKIDEAVLSSVGIAFIDINGLKNINDTYGHSFGDAVITKTAKDIKKHFVSEQVYRLSGDEFVVLCPNMDRSNFVAKIRELIKAFKEEDNESLAIGYTWADQDIDIQVLIHQADEQMYVDKQAYYEKSLVKGRHYRPRLREDLINSIKKGEFVMYLQPKANIYTGEITGAEALVRHNHP